VPTTINRSEYSDKLQHPALFFEDPLIKNGMVVIRSNGLPFLASGANAVTFKFTDANGQTVAVRCFSVDLKDGLYSDLAVRYHAVSAFVEGVQSPYFASFEYQPRGIFIAPDWLPILKMEWVEGVRLTDYVLANIHERQKITRLANAFRAMIKTLEMLGCAHGDLQHGNILVDASGRLRLVDYDGMFVSSLAGKGAIEIGERNYQHSKRTADHFDAHLDRFSAIGIYLSLRALAVAPRLLPINDDGKLDILLFREGDIKSPADSKLMNCLWALGFARPVQEFSRLCAADYESFPSLETFIAETELDVITVSPDRDTATECETVLIAEEPFAQLNTAASKKNTSTAPAPNQLGSTQIAPPPNPAFGALPQPQFTSTLSPAAPPVPVPTSVKAPPQPIAAPFKPTPLPTAMGMTASAVPAAPTPKPPASIPTTQPSVAATSGLGFIPRQRIPIHFLWGCIAGAVAIYPLLERLFRRFSILNQSESNTYLIIFAAYSLVSGITYSWLTYRVQRAYERGVARRLSTLVSLFIQTAIGAGALEFTIIQILLTDNLAFLTDVTRLIHIGLGAFAFVLPVLFIRPLFWRVVIGSILMVGVSSVVDYLYFNEFMIEPSASNLAFAFAFSVLVWVPDLWRTSFIGRRLQAGGTTELFLARVSVLLPFAALCWGALLILARLGSGYKITAFSAPILLAEMLIPAAVFALFAAWATLNIESHAQTNTHPSRYLLRNSFVAIVLSSIVSIFWYGTLEGQFPSGSIDFTFLIRNLNFARAFIPSTMFAAGFVFTLASIMLMISARNGQTRRGHVVRGTILNTVVATILVGVVIFPILSNWVSRVVNLNSPSLVMLAAIAGGITAALSLILIIPMWFADYLAQR